ncbi:MAG: hypothetical protein V7761_11205, partial [Amylibacter sp.]
MNIKFHKYKEPRADYAGPNRRMFLTTTAMAGVATGAMLSGINPAMAKVLGDNGSETILQMVQDIYPHPGLLKVSHYEAITNTIVASADEDIAKADTLRDGLAKLNEKAQELHGNSYLEIEDADTREGLLRHFQDGGFFQSVRWAAYFGIYDNKEIWPLFGYQGSSVEHG